MSRGERQLFVLDTSVLIHDPTALFRFEEHDVCLPMAVLEELDHAKQGVTEVARNARQASRLLDERLAGMPPERLAEGVALGEGPGAPSGRLYFETGEVHDGEPPLLAAARRLQTQGKRPVVLVSKDINLRIRATVAGIPAEDFHSDRVIDDLDVLYSGVERIPEAAWAAAEEVGERLRLPVPEGVRWRVNQCLYAPDDSFDGVAREVAGGEALLERLVDYGTGPAVWGIHARNREQNFALNLLMDPEIDFVTLVGAAGTGKTLLTLAAALAQTLDTHRYREVIMTRATVSLGEEIGYLPGTEEEKMTPWMGALMDNLEVLGQPETGGEWGRAATADLIHSRIKVRSLNFMRGRTFLEKVLILDEAQNLTATQMRALITRAGPGTKVVCLGNIAQIDTPYLTEATSGLTYVVDRFKDWPHSGHVTLTRGERSRLADHASEVL